MPTRSDGIPCCSALMLRADNGVPSPRKGAPAMMKSPSRRFMLAPALLLIAGISSAADYPGTINLFRHAGESASFFHRSFGYAVFPTVGEGGLGVGGAFGKGRVYEKGMAVFTIAKGGLMYAATIAGQRFSFTPRGVK